MRKTFGPFVLFLVTITLVSGQITGGGGNQCTDLQPVCSGLENVDSPSNTVPAPFGPDYGCLSSQPNPTWYLLQVGQSGNISFTLTQFPDANNDGIPDNNNPIDVDFIVWGPFENPDGNCNNLSNDKIVDCSFSPLGEETILIPNANLGEYYIMLITNFDGGDGVFNLDINSSSTGTTSCAIIGDGAYSDCDYDGDNVLEFDLVMIESDHRENANEQFKFYENEIDATNDNTNNLTGTTYNFNKNLSPETIYAQVQEDGSITKIIQIILESATIPEASTATLDICDLNGDGIEVFNLTDAEDDIAQGQLNLKLSFYENLTDAEMGMNAIPNPTNYSSSDTTIYVRVENDSCFNITTLDLRTSVQPKLIAGDYDLFACDNDNNNQEMFDLTINEISMLGGQTDVSIRYFTTQADADANTNQIPNPQNFVQSLGSSSIFVRLENDNKNECFDTLSFNVTVADSPQANDFTTNTCDDGTNSIDLNEFDDSITSDSSAVVSYHLTQNEADNNLNAQTSFNASLGSNTLFVRVESSGNAACFNVATLTINVVNQPEIVAGNYNLFLCDVDGNGEEVFDLTLNEAAMIGSQTGVSLSYHGTQSDADANTNPIANPQNFVQTLGSSTIFVRLENDANNECFDTLTFDVDVFDSPEANAVQRTFCDDGINEITLDDLNTEVNNANGVNITYHLTENDALNNQNPINIFGAQLGLNTLFARVSDSTNPDCFATSEITLLIEIQPSIIEGDYNLETCDSAFDGKQVVDLTVHENAMLGGQTNMSFSYYLSQTDAENDQNAINDPANFVQTNANTTIFVRLSNDSSPQCFDIVSLSSVLIEPPSAQSIEEEFCDDGINEFVLSDFDNQINSSGFAVSYHLTQADAETGSNPQTIYQAALGDNILFARVENTGFSDCVNTSTLIIRVFENPEIVNGNYDLSRCDVANDGQEVFDLTTNEAAMLGGQTNLALGYYLSQTDAQLDQNAIQNPSNFLITNSPTTIFVRLFSVDNMDCFDVSSFEVGLSQSPEVNTISPPTFCDDGINLVVLSAFDNQITQTSNTNISYHLNQADAQTNINPVTEINASIGSNTIFVRVEDTSNSDCFGLGSFDIIIDAQPLIIQGNYDLQQCDTDSNSEETFDLTQFEAAMLGTQTNMSFSYYTSQADAQAGANAIANPTNLTQSTGNQVIFVRLENTSNTNCFDVISFTIETLEFPTFESIAVQEQCDDGNNTFSLSSFNNSIYTGGLPVNITYHSTAQEASDGSNSLPDDYVAPLGSSQVFVRIESTISNCIDASGMIEFIILENPSLNPDQTLLSCDMDGDGQATFDLNQINTQLVQDIAGLAFTYYSSMDDALNATNALPENYMATQSGELIYARVQNSNGCFSIESFELIFGNASVNTLPIPLQSCDESDGVENDGNGLFDLTSIESEIEAIFGNMTTYTFHLNQSDADSGTNPIANPESYIGASGTIFTRVTNNGSCTGRLDFELIVNPTPIITFPVVSPINFCPGDKAMVTAQGVFDRVEWYFNGSIISQNNTLIPNETGSYTLVAYNDSSCSTSLDIQINISELIQISNIQVVQNESITIVTDPLSDFAPFEYSINNFNWQTTPVFDFNNYTGGLHRAYVRNSIGCVSDAFDFTLLTFPNTITPNGDGINDVWRFEGEDLLDELNVKIFDRYGKPIVERVVNNGSFEWDAKYRSQPVPTGTYWYIIETNFGQKLTGWLVVKHE